MLHSSSVWSTPKRYVPFRTRTIVNPAYIIEAHIHCLKFRRQCRTQHTRGYILTHPIASPKAPQHLPTTTKLRVIPYACYIVHVSQGNNRAVHRSETIKSFGIRVPGITTLVLKVNSAHDIHPSPEHALLHLSSCTLVCLQTWQPTPDRKTAKLRVKIVRVRFRETGISYYT